MPGNLIPTITLSEEQQKKLVLDLDEKISVCKEYHSEWSQDHGDHLDWYLCRPEFEHKISPWEDCSNVFLPLIKVNIDGILAQFHDALLSNHPFLNVHAIKSTGINYSEALTILYGHHVYADSGPLPMRKIGTDWIFDTCLDGTGVLKTRLDRRELLRRMLIREDGPEGGRFLERALVKREKVPAIDNIDMERLFVPPTAGPGMNWPHCSWYYEEQYLTWDELVRRRNLGIYRNVDDDLKKQLGQTPSTEKERIARENEGLSPSSNIPSIQMYEFHMRLVLPASYQDETGEKKQDFMDESGVPEECVVTYFPQVKKIARITPLDRIRNDNRRSHVDARFNRIPRQFYGEGIAARLKHLQASANSFFNQMVDYGQLQNMPWMLYSPADMGDMAERVTIEPGAMIPCLDPRAVQVPRLQGDYQFWNVALNQIFAQAERVGALNDFTLGASPTRPNSPDTARATAMLVQASQIAFSWKTAQIAGDFTILYDHVHELYRQLVTEEQPIDFWDDEKDDYVKMVLVPEMFREPVKFEMVINPNQEARQQANQTMFSLLGPLIIQANQGDPNSIRPLAEQVYNSLPNISRPFDEIWPLPPPVQVQAPPPIGPDGSPNALSGPMGGGQPQGPMPMGPPPGMPPGMPPQPPMMGGGGPPMPGPGMMMPQPMPQMPMMPQFPPMGPPPELEALMGMLKEIGGPVELTAEEEGVKLQ